MINNLSGEDKVYFNLKSIYDEFGYKHYKMRKFEEYSLYAENRNFLKNDYIITFNDLSGKLLALKPDVTLSIVKNTTATPSKTEKLYYKESVYRLNKNSKTFKEISQIGVELLGDVDGYLTLEILSLALKTLGTFGTDYALDLSHMGIVMAVLNEYGLTDCPDELKKCISSKNVHDIKSVVNSLGDYEGLSSVLASLLSAEGDFEKILGIAESVVPKSAYNAINELRTIYKQLKTLGYGDKINLDFSIVSDHAYYNGIVFQGFIEKIPKAVLLGGRYDNLVKKFKNEIGGIGFALYLDDFYYCDKRSEYDSDVLIVYKKGADPVNVFKTAREKAGLGLSVRVEKCVPADLKFKEIIEV